MVLVILGLMGQMSRMSQIRQMSWMSLISRISRIRRGSIGDFTLYSLLFTFSLHSLFSIIHSSPLLGGVGGGGGFPWRGWGRLLNSSSFLSPPPAAGCPWLAGCRRRLTCGSMRLPCPRRRSCSKPRRGRSTSGGRP